MNTHDLAAQIVGAVVHSVDRDTAIHDVQALLDAHVSMRPDDPPPGVRWGPVRWGPVRWGSVAGPFMIDHVGVGLAKYRLDPPVRVLPTDQCFTSIDGSLTVRHADGSEERFVGTLDRD